MIVRLTYAAINVAFLLAVLHCLERPAYGYVDPGSGLQICQSVGALVAGVLFYFRRRVKSMFDKTSDQ